MILILLLDGTAEIQSLGWERGWPLCGPAAPCTSLLGCSSSFGILRKQAAFLQDEDLACHYGFPEVGGRDKKGVYLGVRVGRKKECLTFDRNSMDLRFPQGVKGIKNSSGCFLRSPPPRRGIPFHLVMPNSGDSDFTCFQRLAALCCGTECPLKGQAARANSASEGCMTDITSRME